jgi:hypothetical protein
MANELVNFNLPSPYQADLAKIAQQQKMAELLQAQSLQPTERYSYKGIEAHTPATAGLAKILQAMGGAYLQKQGLEEQKALGERYRADQSADFTNLAKMLSAPAVAGSPAVPERLAEPPTIPTDDEGNPMPGVSAAPAIPAVASRIKGQIDPEMIGQFKTPETQQMAMAQLLAQIGPKTPIKASAGDVFFDAQGRELFRAPEKQEYGTTPHYEMVDGKPHAVVYDKQGNKKDLGPASPQNQFTTGTVDAQAKLAQDRAISDRNFNQLSANQQAQLKNDAARLGISAEQLFFDTGVRAGGAAMPPATGPSYLPVPTAAGAAPAAPGMPQTAQPVGQPVPAPGAAPVQAAPRIGMAPARAAQPTVAFAPNAVGPSGKPVTEAKPLIDTVTPKERQALMVAQPQQNVAAQSALQNMERLINVATELKDHPGLNSIVGKANQYSVFDMTDNATNARALQSSLVKQSAVNALQAMRDASKTGGAVGAVSEKEWPILEQQLAALDGAQTTTAYKAALTNLTNQLTTSSKRVRNAYEQTYGQLKYESTPYKQQQLGINEEIPTGSVRRIR